MNGGSTALGRKVGGAKASELQDTSLVRGEKEINATSVFDGGTRLLNGVLLKEQPNMGRRSQQVPPLLVPLLSQRTVF